MANSKKRQQQNIHILYILSTNYLTILYGDHMVSSALMVYGCIIYQQGQHRETKHKFCVLAKVLDCRRGRYVKHVFSNFRHIWKWKDKAYMRTTFLQILSKSKHEQMQRIKLKKITCMVMNAYHNIITPMESSIKSNTIQHKREQDTH